MKTISAITILFFTSCASLTYKGKYAKLTATPTGVIIIEPYYAKWNKYLHDYSKVDLIG